MTGAKIKMEQGPRSVGNYAASLFTRKMAKSCHFLRCYLSRSSTCLSRLKSSHKLLGITADNEFKSHWVHQSCHRLLSILALLGRASFIGLKPVEGDVPIDSLDRFVEAGACGTAAVILTYWGIQHGDDFHVFYSETEVGPAPVNYTMNWQASTWWHWSARKAGLQK